MSAATEQSPLASLLPMLLAVILIPVLLGSSATIFNDGDVSWHIATGQWIIAHQSVPHTDPFSFTWAGKPWVPIEWGAEVIMAGVYRAAAYAGLAALATLVLGALSGLVYFNAIRFVRPWVALGAVVAMDLVLVPMTLVRPHLLAWPLIALWTLVMLRAREKGRAPPFAAALLMVVWANLHGSFVMGLAIAAAFGLDALLSDPDKAKVLRQWGLFGLACLAAIFINANGVEGVLHPLRIANLAMLPLIDEWKPSSPAVTPFFFAVLVAVAVLLWRRRPRLSAMRWLLLGALLVLAMIQVRHQAVLAIVAAMVLPTGFESSGEVAKVDRRLAGVAAAAIGVLALVRASLPLQPPESETNPWLLIAAVPAELRALPVLNGYSMGGPLVLAGIRPYVDGRGDMYGDELVVGYKKITLGDAAELDAVTRRWGIRWAILPHRYTRLLALLDRTPGWRKIADTQSGVIYVRG
ncbi:MAG: hypothetical protein V4444_04175 [Pseudomonadota bacterium]